MDTITGIPAHPLFVHIPVVLLPLGAILAIVMLIKQQWFDRYKWMLLGVVGVGALGAILAASSGEALQESVESGGESAGLEAHAEAGEMARTLGIVFFVVVVAWIVVPMLLKRRAASKGAADAGMPTWFRPVIAVLVLACAAGSVFTVIDAGHSGAKQVWNEEGDGEGGDEGGAPALVPAADQVIVVSAAAG
ncbi:MAG: hypothetical protein NTZ21_06290 [Actinobacteria bacterium]|nr:hypothetical protein [Actinomycetota bacterium]